MIKIEDILSIDLSEENNIIIIQKKDKTWMAGQLSRFDGRIKKVEKLLDLVTVWLKLPRYVTIHGPKR